MARALTSRTVLLVDDEPLFIESVRDTILARRSQTAVLVAQDGESALAHIDRTHVDLLVTDLRMPGLDGLGLLGALAARRVHLPTIALTAHASSSATDALLAGGAFAVLSKPVELSMLLALVDRCLDQPEEGAIQSVSLAGFLQLLGIESRTCSVRVASGGRSGRIALLDGAAIDARLPPHDPLGAISEMLSWRDATLIVEPLAEWAHPRIDLPLTHLLMEAARASDERKNTHERRRTVTEREMIASVERAFRDSSFPRASTDHTEATSALRKGPNMGTVKETLDKAMGIDGAIAAALVDYESGLTLGTAGGGSRFDIEVAATGNTQVVRSKLAVMRQLGIEGLEDVLITLTAQYHLIRPLRTVGTLFLYLAIDRQRGNLGMARHQLTTLERELKI